MTVTAQFQSPLRWDRDVVVVEGPDAGRYLQGQLSQDIEKLALHRSAWTLVLQPQGKLEVFCRVTRTGEQEFHLDTDGGMGEALVARLQRFKLRTKASIEVLDGWGALAVREVPSGAPAQAGPFDMRAWLAQAGIEQTPASFGPHVVAGFEWHGWRGFDILGQVATFDAVGLPPLQASAARFELARILAGFPRHGAELDDKTIPAEADLVQASVSFTKGCYTGQELVARVDSRGNNVPRRLYGLIFSGEGTPAAGNGLVSTERQVGRITSVAEALGGRWYGLGYANRSAGVGDVLAVEGAQMAVELSSLPIPAQ